MNISKTNFNQAFKGNIVVVDSKNRKRTFAQYYITDVIKYKNGTLIRYNSNKWSEDGDYFISSKNASFEDISRAYNMAVDGNRVTVDLTKSSVDYNA